MFQDEQPLEDNKTLGDCGFTNQTSSPQTPVSVGLAFRIRGVSQTMGLPNKLIMDPHLNKYQSLLNYNKNVIASCNN